MEQRKLEEIVIEQRSQFERLNEEIIERDILSEVKGRIESPFIMIISGIRRCGKSTLMKLIRKDSYKDQNVHYFSFEDERLFEFDLNDFNLLLETLLMINGRSNIFFFDEIQNINGWEVFVRRLHDSGAKIYITGSNSTMISKELGSRLTGRFIRLELFPFSFREFLRYRGVSFDEFLGTEERAAIKASFEEYLRMGGFPEYVKMDDKKYLMDLFESIVYRDIVSRYNIIDERPLKECLMYIFSNYGNDLNLSRLKRDLGLGSVNTLKSYMQYMVDSYLVFQVHRYDPSVRKQIHSKKKMYVVDQGLIETISFKFSQDRGRILENIVLVELMRRGKLVHYFRNGYEWDGYNISLAIQVTQTLGLNEKREIDGLMKTVKANRLEEGLLLTENIEETREIDGIKIEIRPIWKWLLMDH